MAAEYLERMGARIAARREELGLTQEDVARELPGKISGQRVSLWERGKHRPRDDSLEALARILKVDVSYFMATPADKSNGTPDLLEAAAATASSEDIAHIKNELAAVRALLQALATRFEIDVPPPPQGELGRRLRAVEPNPEDQARPETPPEGDSRSDTGE